MNLEILGENENNMIRRVIRNTYIVEMGIIKDVSEYEDTGYVTVIMSVSDDVENIVITKCILANIASSSISIKVKPNVDDKVIVLFPRMYSSSMFDPATNEPVVSEYATGYCQNGGIALLMNQFNADTYKNYVSIEDGVLTANLAYSEDDEKNLITLSTTANGAVSLTVGKNTVSIDEENAITISSNEGKSTISIDSEGNISVNANGKLTIKNGSTSLKTLLNNIISPLNLGQVSTQGSPSSHVIIAGQFNDANTALSSLFKE